MNATIQNMQDTGPSDGWEKADYELMWELQASGKQVEVLEVECEVDGIFEHDYHNIRVAPGRLIIGVSGHHLARVTNP